MVKEVGIRVVGRFRPINKREVVEAAGFGWEEDELRPCTISDANKCVTVKIKQNNQPRFTLDYFLPETSDQEQTFISVALPCVKDVMKGINGTVFAYGQTGSGKTWSMFGPEMDVASLGEHTGLLGLIPRAATTMFQALDNSELLKWQMSLSVLEIYVGNTLRDLLHPKKKGDAPLRIRDGPRGVFVQGLKPVPILCLTDVLVYIAKANKHRTVSVTKMNATSSRSHSIFTLDLKTVTRSGTKKSAKVSFCDLAGSEKVGKTGAQGHQLKEGTAINASLTALGQVITALVEHRQPSFRDTALTHALKDSLAGNCKTTILVCLSPHRFNVLETVNTLRFAQRAKLIKNKIKVNKTLSTGELHKMIKKLKDEVKILKLQLERKAARTVGAANPDEGVPFVRLFWKGKKFEDYVDYQATEDEVDDIIYKVKEKIEAKALKTKFVIQDSEDGAGLEMVFTCEASFDYEKDDLTKARDTFKEALEVVTKYDGSTKETAKTAVADPTEITCGFAPDPNAKAANALDVQEQQRILKEMQVLRRENGDLKEKYTQAAAKHKELTRECDQLKLDQADGEEAWQRGLEEIENLKSRLLKSNDAVTELQSTLIKSHTLKDVDAGEIFADVDNQPENLIPMSPIHKNKHKKQISHAEAFAEMMAKEAQNALSREGTVNSLGALGKNETYTSPREDQAPPSPVKDVMDEKGSPIKHRKSRVRFDEVVEVSSPGEVNTTLSELTKKQDGNDNTVFNKDAYRRQSEPLLMRERAKTSRAGLSKNRLFTLRDILHFTSEDPEDRDVEVKSTAEMKDMCRILRLELSKVHRLVAEVTDAKEFVRQKNIFLESQKVIASMNRDFMEQLGSTKRMLDQKKVEISANAERIATLQAANEQLAEENTRVLNALKMIGSRRSSESHSRNFSEATSVASFLEDDFLESVQLREVAQLASTQSASLDSDSVAESDLLSGLVDDTSSVASAPIGGTGAMSRSAASLPVLSVHSKGPKTADDEKEHSPRHRLSKTESDKDLLANEAAGGDVLKSLPKRKKKKRKKRDPSMFGGEEKKLVAGLITKQEEALAMDMRELLKREGSMTDLFEADDSSGSDDELSEAIEVDFISEKQLIDWTVSDVCKWISQCDGTRLRVFVNLFHKNAVTGEVLLSLSRRELKHDFGMKRNDIKALYREMFKIDPSFKERMLREYRRKKRKKRFELNDTMVVSTFDWSAVLRKQEASEPWNQKKITCVVGDIVRLADGREGRILFNGETHFGEGNWFGIELLTGKGKNDGSAKGKRYFRTKPGQGAFVRQGKIDKKLDFKTLNTSIEKAVDAPALNDDSFLRATANAPVDERGIPKLENPEMKEDDDVDWDLSSDSERGKTRAPGRRSDLRVDDVGDDALPGQDI